MTSLDQGLGFALAGKTAPCKVGFLLAENFTLGAFAGALDALRLTNQLAGKQRFSWVLYSSDGAPVRCSAGITIDVAEAFTRDAACDLLFVCGGHDAQRHHLKAAAAVLRHKARRGLPMIAICTGAYLLAQAGVLTGGKCTIHWDHSALLSEQYPELSVEDSLYEVNAPGIVTCSGGVAVIDLMVALIRIVVDERIAVGVAEKMVYRHGRLPASPQRFASAALSEARDSHVIRATEIMKQHVRDPIPIARIAQMCGVSSRQLERKFAATLGLSPRRFFLELRLAEAQALLLDTNMSWREVADLLSFRSAKDLRDKVRAPAG